MIENNAVTPSGGNLFADLGFDNPQEAHRLNRLDCAVDVVMVRHQPAKAHN